MPWATQAIEHKVSAAWVAELGGTADQNALKIYLNEELVRLEKAATSDTQ